MRLWTIHPRHLDTKGLVALWREGLLAQAVLDGETTGYTAHPQLERWRGREDALACYLRVVLLESRLRGYRFDASKIKRQGRLAAINPVLVTTGQIDFERQHLQRKLATRARPLLGTLPKNISINPVFRVTAGGVEPWEKT